MIRPAPGDRRQRWHNHCDAAESAVPELDAGEQQPGEVEGCFWRRPVVHTSSIGEEAERRRRSLCRRQAAGARRGRRNRPGDRASHLCSMQQIPSAASRKWQVCLTATEVVFTIHRCSLAVSPCPLRRPRRVRSARGCRAQSCAVPAGVPRASPHRAQLPGSSREAATRWPRGLGSHRSPLAGNVPENRPGPTSRVERNRKHTARRPGTRKGERVPLRFCNAAGRQCFPGSVNSWRLASAVSMCVSVPYHITSHRGQGAIWVECRGCVGVEVGPECYLLGAGSGGERDAGNQYQRNRINLW